MASKYIKKKHYGTVDELSSFFKDSSSTNKNSSSSYRTDTQESRVSSLSNFFNTPLPKPKPEPVDPNAKFKGKSWMDISNNLNNPQKPSTGFNSSQMLGMGQDIISGKYKPTMPDKRSGVEKVVSDIGDITGLNKAPLTGNVHSERTVSSKSPSISEQNYNNVMSTVIPPVISAVNPIFTALNALGNAPRTAIKYDIMGKTPQAYTPEEIKKYNIQPTYRNGEAYYPTKLPNRLENNSIVGFGKGLIGMEETSPLEVMMGSKQKADEFLERNPVAGNIIDYGGYIIGDPLTYVGAPAFNAAKSGIAKIASKASRFMPELAEKGATYLAKEAGKKIAQKEAEDAGRVTVGKGGRIISEGTTQHSLAKEIISNNPYYKAKDVMNVLNNADKQANSFIQLTDDVTAPKKATYAPIANKIMAQSINGANKVIKEYEPLASKIMGNESKLAQGSVPQSTYEPIANKVINNAKSVEDIQYKPIANKLMDTEISPPIKETGGIGDVQASKKTTSLLRNKLDGTAEMTKRSDIEKFISETLDIPVTQGKFRQKALGIFKVKPEVIRLKGTKDLDTLFHETGHFLDKKFSLANDTFKDELVGLGKATSGKDYSTTQQMAEGVAEFVRHYTIDPVGAKAKAPNFYDHFESIIKGDKNISDMMETIRTATKNYQAQDPTKRILSNVSVGEVGEKVTRPFEKMYSTFFNDIAPIERVTKDIAGKTDLPVDLNPGEKAILHRGWRGKAEAILKNGVRDKDYNLVSRGFEDILKPVQKDINNFRAYIISKRAKELYDRGIKQGMDIADIDHVVNKFKDTTVEFKSKINGKKQKITKTYDEISNELTDFQDKALNLLVDSGILSKEKLATIKELNKNYIPLYKVQEGLSHEGMGKGFQSRNPLRRIGNSSKDIIDPFESIIKNVYTITNLASKNDVGNALVNLAEKFEGTGKILDKVPPNMKGQSFSLDEIKSVLKDAGADVNNLDLDAIATVFRPANYGKDSNIISVFRNGKPEYFELFDKDLYNSMLSMDKESSNMLVDMLSVPAKILRAGATLTPEFAARNPIRDMWSAAIYSKYGFRPVVDSARGLFHAIGKTDLYYKWLSSGAGNADMISMDRNYLQKSLRKGIKGYSKEYMKSQNIVGKAKAIGDIALNAPLEPLRGLSKLTEESTRLGEFARGVKKEGATRQGIQKAGLASRDITLDFARSGSKIKQPNKAIAFLNANLQGTDKMIRQFKAHPFQSTWKAMAFITIPSIANYLGNKDNPYYEERPQWEKDTFWHIPINDGKNFIKVPKPFELGLLFGTVPERILRWIDKEDPTALNGLTERFADTFVPNVIPTGLQPYIENLTNYSLFRNAAIVPRSEEGLEPAEQYGENTSEVAKAIGSLLNYSPRKIDNLITGYGGGLGKTGTEIVDTLSGNNRFTKDNMPVVKGFTTKDMNTGAQSIGEFYEQLNKYEAKYKSDIKKGEAETGEPPEYLKSWRKRAQEISDVRKYINEIRAYKPQNSKEKDGQERDLKEQTLLMINLAREPLEKKPIDN